MYKVNYCIFKIQEQESIYIYFRPADSYVLPRKTDDEH